MEHVGILVCCTLTSWLYISSMAETLENNTLEYQVIITFSKKQTDSYYLQRTKPRSPVSA